MAGCVSKDKAEVATWDEDDADLAPSQKQEVRAHKSIAMLSSDDFLGKLCQAMIVSKPLADFMDKISLLENSRAKMRLRASGLQLQDTAAPCSPDDIASMTLDVWTGREGLVVVSEFASILGVSMADERWLPRLGSASDFMNIEESFLTILTCMTDAWKRLVFKFLCHPWQLFAIASCL
jgi:hypothetical protein